MPPLIARRFVAVIAVIGFLASAAYLLLVDGSISYLSLVGDLQDVVTRIGRRAESRSGVDLLDRADVPGQEDDYGHAIFWGTGMLLIGWIMRRRIRLSLTALLVGATSLLFEVLQSVVTAHRATEPTDAIANVTGIAVAACCLGVLFALLRRFSTESAPTPSAYAAP